MCLQLNLLVSRLQHQLVYLLRPVASRQSSQVVYQLATPVQIRVLSRLVSPVVYLLIYLQPHQRIHQLENLRPLLVVSPLELLRHSRAAFQR